MFSRDAHSAESIHSAINRRALPVLALAMIAVTGVAVVLGWKTFCGRMGMQETLATYFWIVLWTGLAEGVALLVGLVAFFLVSRRITRPLGELSRAVARQAQDGGAANFRTDGPIVEINALSASFNELFAVRERQARELRDLTRNVLHDLRTPLTHIRHCAELVHEGEADPVSSMETVAEACDAVLNLVDTNAEISANYSGLDAIPPEDLDVSRILSDLLELYAVVAESKHIVFTLSLPKTPLRFCGHRNRIQHLVVNLLDNAFKFTPEGGTVALTAEEADKGLRLSVSDSGIGISAADRPHVFERFYRAKSGRSVPGNGLGLSLAHAIVTFYGGTLDCRSKEGQGTVFAIFLPTSRAEGSPAGDSGN